MKMVGHFSGFNTAVGHFALNGVDVISVPNPYPNNWISDDGIIDLDGDIYLDAPMNLGPEK
jgi:hypothetical protein